MDQPRDTREMRYGFKAQSIFETAEALDAAYAEAVIDPFSVTRDIINVEIPANHGSRNPVEQNLAHSTSGSAAMFPINGPVNLDTIDHYLYSFFQKVVEEADTTFTKTFTWFATHPIFSDDEGHFLTWIVRRPETATSSRYAGCICTGMKISGERDAVLRFESQWRGFGVGTDGETPSGTWTIDDISNLVWFNDCVSATLSFDSGFDTPIDIVVKDFEIDMSHEYEKAGHSTTGFEAPALFGRAGTFKVHLMRDSSADEAIANLKAGTLVQFAMDFGLLAFDISGKITDPIETDDEGMLAETLNCEMYASAIAGSVGEPVTIVVENTNDRSWPDS